MRRKRKDIVYRNIVPETLVKIREWACCFTQEELAKRIVYGFVSDVSDKKIEQNQESLDQSSQNHSDRTADRGDNAFPEKEGGEKKSPLADDKDLDEKIREEIRAKKIREEKERAKKKKDYEKWLVLIKSFEPEQDDAGEGKDKGKDDGRIVNVINNLRENPEEDFDRSFGERTLFGEKIPAEKEAFVRDNRDQTASGRKKPTFEQLEEIAKACFTLDIFFLQPPENFTLPGLPDMDFRKNREERIENRRECLPFIFKSIENQRWASDCIYKNNPGYRASFLDFDKELPRTHEELLKVSKQLVEKIKKDLDLDWNKWYASSSKKQFDALRDAIDKKNILVFTTNNKRDHIDFEVLRGFAIYDEVAPLIALNDGDVGYNNAREKVFTLVHELAHLYMASKSKDGKINFLFQAVVSFGEGREEERLEGEEIKHLERFCNMVAEELIMSAEEFEQKLLDDFFQEIFEEEQSEQLEQAENESAQKIADHFTSVAKKRMGPSRWVLLYRARNLGKLNATANFSQKKIDGRGWRIFNEVCRIFADDAKRINASKKIEAIQKKVEQKEKALEKKEVAKEEVEKKNRDSAKTLVGSNGRFFSRLAIADYLSSELDSQTLRYMLGTDKQANILSLTQRGVL